MSLIQFNGFIPVYVIDYAAAVVVLIILIGVIYKFRAWSKVVPSGLFRDAKTQIHTSGLVGMFFSELGERVLVQRLVFMDSGGRRAVHLAVFWGFLGLAFATVWDDIFFRDGTLPTPLSSANFGNIVGNISGAVVLIGMSIMILRYAVTNKWRNTYKGDLSFLFVLYLATITGFVTEVARYSPDWLAYSSYGIHLVFIGALLITAPFTHFFHALLTPFTRYIERINNTLAAKGVNQYPFYRRLQMANLADQVRDGKTTPTYPTWLASKADGKREQTEQRPSQQAETPPEKKTGE